MLDWKILIHDVFMNNILNLKFSKVTNKTNFYPLMRFYDVPRLGYGKWG